MVELNKISGVRLKKGLSKIKKSVVDKVGGVWKLNKTGVIDKIKQLGYRYNENNETLTTSSTIRTKKGEIIKQYGDYIDEVSYLPLITSYNLNYIEYIMGFPLFYQYNLLIFCSARILSCIQPQSEVTCHCNIY